MASLETAPLPTEQHLRPSLLVLLVLAVQLLALLWLILWAKHDLGVAMGGAAPIIGATFALMFRANRTGARGLQALSAGRLDEARTFLTLAARRSRAFPQLHSVHVYNLALVELREQNQEAGVALLSTCWRESGSPSLRALIANAFAEAWRLADNAPAAQAWSAEAQRVASEASQTAPPTANIAREQAWLRRGGFAAILGGAIGLSVATRRYPPLVVDDALTAPLPIAVAAVLGVCWVVLLWWRARAWNTSRMQLWLSLSLTGLLGVMGLAMAGYASVLALNVALDQSPVVAWRGGVVDIEPYDREGKALRVRYLDPRDRGSVQIEIVQGAMARRLDAGAQALFFHAHRGAFGLAWIEHVTAE